MCTFKSKQGEDAWASARPETTQEKMLLIEGISDWQVSVSALVFTAGIYVPF